MVTDQDVHREGHELLPAAKCVMLGSHPKYVTEAMLDTLDAYVEGGGRLMDLGGNGLYWVTSLDPTRPWIMEVRKSGTL